MTILCPPENTEKLRTFLGEDLYQRQRASRHVCISLEQNALFLAFYFCDVENICHKEERISLYCNHEILLFVGASRRCISILEDMPQDLPPMQALVDFLFALTAGDVDRLEQIENDIGELEASLISAKKPVRRSSARIIQLRRDLLRLKRYYEQLDILLDQLLENENGALPPEAVRRLTALAHRVDRLTESVLHLREFVTQVREAYQAQIDIEQNQIMKIFTVITAVFLPLTLIVGWYGMNFQMPEFTWRYGYLYVILLSVAVCATCVLIFKRRKWF